MSIVIQNATPQDLRAIIALLADDPIGAAREVVSVPIDRAYLDAFEAIQSDPNQQLLVAVLADEIVGCVQLSFLPGLSRRGMWRGQIEGVRVASAHRGGGIGTLMIRHAVELCRERGCGLVQLTSDKHRPEAVRFYESLGFAASHEGLKLALT